MQVWVESSNQRNQVLRRCWCSDSMQLTQSDQQLLSWYVRPQALQCRMAVPNGQIPWCPCPQMAASQRQRRWSDVPAEPAIFHQAFHLMWLEFEKSGAGMLISFRDLLWHSEAISEKEKKQQKDNQWCCKEPCSHNSCSVCPLGGAFLLWAEQNPASCLASNGKHGNLWAEQSCPHHRTSTSGILANPTSCLASNSKHGNAEKYPQDPLQNCAINSMCVCIFTRNLLRLPQNAHSLLCRDASLFVITPSCQILQRTWPQKLWGPNLDVKGLLFEAKHEAGVASAAGYEILEAEIRWCGQLSSAHMRPMQN